MKIMQQSRVTLMLKLTHIAARTKGTCDISQNSTKRRLKYKSQSKMTTLSWKPEYNMRNISFLVITATFLLMFAGVTTANNAVNSFNTHITPRMINRVREQYSQPLYVTAFNDQNADDEFRPIIPKDIKSDSISQSIFTHTGQYRVFQPVESDLRRATAIDNSYQRQQKLTNQRMWETESMPLNAVQHGYNNEIAKFTKSAVALEEASDEAIKKTKFAVDKHLGPSSPTTASTKTATKTATKTVTKVAMSTTARTATTETPTTPQTSSKPATLKEILTTELKSLEDLLFEYVENFFNKGEFKPQPELVIELQNKHSNSTATTTTTATSPTEDIDKDNFVRRVRGTATGSSSTFPSSLSSDASADEIHINLPRALQTGRLLFFTGLKKILWPIFVGLQILKSMLLAIFLPSLIGSFGKLVGKGIASASIRPLEPPQELDFRDNSFNFDEENNKFIINDDGKDGPGYAYNQPDASQTHYSHTTYDAANINKEALSRYGINEKQLNKMPDSYMGVLQSLGAASFKNSGSFSSASSQPGGAGGGGGISAGATLVSPAMRPKPMAAANNFQTFQKVPASSLLLSNYDPFYSPLLSRLDSVFAQLKLNSENEVCREKLICLMYANPAKYAPYSNLVSAQLSRELNELRKPTSDNPDILRFFKYMRAAKDGQDGIDCEESFDSCKEFKDFENPAMVSTYHDINKLVQARKIT